MLLEKANALIHRFVKGWTLIILIFFITATFLIFITALSFMRTLYQLHEEILMVGRCIKS